MNNHTSDYKTWQDDSRINQELEGHEQTRDIYRHFREGRRQAVPMFPRLTVH